MTEVATVAEIPFGGELPAHDGLGLTPWRPSDLPAVLAASSDPEIHEFTSMPEANEDAARDWIKKQAQQRRDGEAVHFALREANGNVVGDAGFVGFEWAHRRAEVGYWVLPQFRQRGIASDALDLVTHWALDSLPVDRIDLFVDPHNAASKRVAEKRGYVFEARLLSFRIYRGQRRDLDLYRQLREPPPPPLASG